MNLTIYIDVLFFLNLIIDYIILSSTALLAGRENRMRRVLASAAVGAVYSVVIFFPQLRMLNIVIFRVAVSIVIVLIAFGFRNIIIFLRVFVTYIIINVFYGGGMYAFYHFTSLGSRMNYSNGVYYIDLPLWLIILLSFAFYFLIKVFTRISDSRIERKTIRKLEICLNGSHIRVNALYDTGNTLYDPISLMPVMLVESEMLRGRLSDKFIECAITGEPSQLSVLHEAYPALKLRLVPFRDITGKKSAVFAFKPERITDCEQNREIAGMLIGITGTRLSQDGAYNALLHSRA